MPPKKDSAGMVAAVLEYSPDVQVDLLAQALLREYMHRREYHETLKVFDEENPRDARTISSRAVMTDLMYLSQDHIARLKSQGIETIMEILCSIRVEKASTSNRTAELQQMLELVPPHIPQSYADELDQLEAQIKKAKKRIKKEKKELKEKKLAKKDGVASEANSTDKKDKSKKKKLLSIEELLEQDDSAKIGQLREAKQQQRQQQQLQQQQDQRVTGPSSDQTPKTKATAKKSEPDSDSDGGSSDGSSESSSSGDAEDYAASLKRIREDEARALEERKSKKGWGDLDALEREDSSSPLRKKLTAPSLRSPTVDGGRDDALRLDETQGGETATATAAPEVGQVLAEQLRTALVGNDRRIPSSFWNQGFFFSEAVTYGLLQNEGGSCGVLAVVQGLIVAELFSGHRILTDDVLRTALSAAVTSILRQVQPDARQVVIIHPPRHQHHHHPCGTAREQTSIMSKFVQMTGFTSYGEVEQYIVQNVLKVWMEPKGQGLLCLMLSCIATHTIHSVANDMDVESSLIVEHGYCSQELVNLLLCGRATSNVHDGNEQHGELMLKGIPGKLPIGFLSYMEHRQIIHVGKFGKHPKAPVWIINHESHYTTLFMKHDARSMIAEAMKKEFTPPMSFDVYFWDQLGGQDEEIRLTVTLEKSPVPPVGKDVMVPYLNDIIRTMPEWKTARVSWNGTDPLL